MGKIVGTAPSQISGSVGLYTFRQTKDGTIISEKVKAKGISNRTLKQCMVQMQMANLQHIYNAFYGALENGFENIPKSQNTRAAFIKANFGKMPVYLIKSAVEVGASVLAPYQSTSARTQLAAGEVTVNIAGTNMAAFDKAVTLKMYASTSATTASTVAATKDEDATTASNAVYKATVVSGAQFLGAVEEDGTAIKTWAATSTGGSSDDLMG